MNVFLFFFSFIFFIVSLNALQKFLERLKVSAGVGIKNGEATEGEKEKPVQLLDEVTFEGIAKFIRSGRCEFIFLLTILLFQHIFYFANSYKRLKQI